jgi:hypothetical protein
MAHVQARYPAEFATAFSVAIGVSMAPEIPPEAHQRVYGPATRSEAAPEGRHDRANSTTASAAIRGCRWRRRCGPSSNATFSCGLIRRTSSRHDALTRRSPFAWRYRMGTAIWLRSARTSHFSTAWSLATNTPGFTDEIVSRTAVSSEVGASDPTSQSFAARFGSGTRNTSGASNEPRNRRQPLTGLVANPAQRTTPVRFTGLVAAYWIARGVEKDSATSINGPEIGQAARTNFSSSEYGRYCSVGYRTVMTSNVSGSAAMNSENSSPVPSMPGRSTSLTTGRIQLRVEHCSSLIGPSAPCFLSEQPDDQSAPERTHDDADDEPEIQARP